MARWTILLFLTVVTVLFIFACKTTDKLSQYELYRQYDIHKFDGNSNNNNYQLFLDSTKGMWFDGKLIMNNDTLLLHGFEKGNLYPTQYWRSGKNKSLDAKDGLLFIKFWENKSSLIDSLKIYDIDNKNGLLKDTVILYRKSIHSNQTTSMNDIIGNYYRFTDASVIFSDANDKREYNLSIEAGFKYNETIKVTGSSPNKCKIQGKWTINGDTVIFIPTKRKWKKKVLERPNFDDKNGVISSADTLVYKDNALWKFNRSTKRLVYKQYSKM